MTLRQRKQLFLYLVKLNNVYEIYLLITNLNKNHKKLPFHVTVFVGSNCVDVLKAARLNFHS